MAMLMYEELLAEVGKEIEVLNDARQRRQCVITEKIAGFDHEIEQLTAKIGSYQQQLVEAELSETAVNFGQLTDAVAGLKRDLAGVQEKKENYTNTSADYFGKLNQIQTRMVALYEAWRGAIKEKRDLEVEIDQQIEELKKQKARVSAENTALWNAKPGQMLKPLADLIDPRIKGLHYPESDRALELWGRGESIERLFEKREGGGVTITKTDPRSGFSEQTTYSVDGRGLKQKFPLFKK
jgi:DNA repair exonuclease SbcCD ATPase subunit